MPESSGSMPDSPGLVPSLAARRKRWLERSLPEQPLLVPSRQPQRLAALEHDDVVAVEVRTHFLDGVDVHDAGAVDAREALRVEARLEVGQRAAYQVRGVGGVEAHVVPFGGQMEDVAHGNEE